MSASSVSTSRASRMTALISADEPLNTSYTTVLAIMLELWSENRLSRALSNLPNMALRSSSKPSLVTLANANCARNPDSPRMMNSSISVRGTSQRFSASCWKPRSSKGLSKAGTKGSVAEATMVEPMASAQLVREPLK